MLEAIISFLPSEGNGAIGALDWTTQERQALAQESIKYICPVCGCIKDLMREEDPTEDQASPEIAEQIAQLAMGTAASSHETKHDTAEDVKDTADKVTDSTLSGRNRNEDGDIVSENNEVIFYESYVPDIRDKIRRHMTAPTNRAQEPPQPTASSRDLVDDVLWALLAVIGVLIVILLYRIAKRTFA
jgi:ubiquitin-conjugating enzyme E2 J1